jgi:apurinic endonuclease APN1
MAGQGNVLGSSFDELAQIISGVGNQDKIGVCFDMAHVFAAGYDISSVDEFASVLADFDATVGLSKIGLFHINDSKTELGSHHDRHALVGGGEIGAEAFRQLLSDSRFTETPKVLELPNQQNVIKDNLAFVRGLTA